MGLHPKNLLGLLLTEEQISEELSSTRALISRLNCIKRTIRNFQLSLCRSYHKHSHTENARTAFYRKFDQKATGTGEKYAHLPRLQHFFKKVCNQNFGLLIQHFRFCETFNEPFREIQGIVPTRWNSCFMCISDTLNCLNAVQSTLIEHKNDSFSPDEIHTMKFLKKVLIAPFSVTEELCKKFCPQSSVLPCLRYVEEQWEMLVIFVYEMIIKTLQDIKGFDDDNIKQIVPCGVAKHFEEFLESIFWRSN